VKEAILTIAKSPSSAARLLTSVRLSLGWGLMIATPLVIFAIFLLIVGANPIELYKIMIHSVFGDFYGFGELLIKATPFILTALATALPAKAGLINVGGEGQLAIGALFSTWAGVFYLHDLPGIIGIPLMMVAGALGGGLWAAIAAFLKVKGNMNETITTLLLNYVALFTVGLFVHGALKDPASFNWPFSPELASQLRLPTLSGSRLHIGIIIAIVIAVIVWFIVAKTRLGFGIRVVGGNALAAMRAGYNVGRTQFWTLVASGAIAGIAGMIVITGIEGRLRPETGATYGYLGFLAAWMAWNHPLWLVGTAMIIGAISITGSSLEMTSGLPSSSVNILMALVLFAILAKGRRGKS
jgi:general nucleoside transport system permease protein